MESLFGPAIDRGTLLLASPATRDVVAVLVAVYAAAVLVKAGARLRGELGRLCLVTAMVIVPSLAAAWFVYDGDVFGALRDGAATEPASKWWMITIKQGDGVAAVSVNILRASLLVGLLTIAASLLVHVGSIIYARSRDTGWLAIHKALIKWPIVIVGGLYLLEIDLSTILLGTSVAVIGLGFMLKETLQNLFTGVTLEVEGSVRQGDWIKVGDAGPSGKVIEKTWRVTKLQTLQDETITVPNRVLATETIKNYNRRNHAQVLFVGASYDDPPVKVKEILRAILLSEPDVLKQPFPAVRTIKYNDFSIDYDMKFWIRDYGSHRAICDRIMTHVWYAFRFNGVSIPFPIRTVHLKEREQLEAEEAAHGAAVDDKQGFLATLSFFEGLARKDLGFLAQNAFGKHYDAGDHVLHKGEIGDALYVVRTGTCLAVLPDGPREIAAGRYFGEMGLLRTGPRTVDVVAGPGGADVLRIDKHCMEVLFRARPALRQEFRHVSEERAKELPGGEHGAAAPRAPFLRRLLRGTANVLRPW